MGLIMITAENLVRHELIGLKVKVESGNMEGRVVDESRNTLTLEVKGKDKKIPKENSVFLFTLPSNDKVRISGEILVGRPEDRIKKKLKQW